MSKDGGPAFPVSGFSSGMTLRDYFAGQALAGITVGCGWQGGPWETMAAHAYEAADAMLAERERG